MTVEHAMSYDISVMRPNIEGRIDYRFSGLNARLVGKAKLAEHFIKNLYGDDIGMLIKTVRETKDWDAGTISNCVYITMRHMKNAQMGESMHPDERLANVSIKKLRIDRSGGVMELEISIVSQSGAATAIML